MPQVRIHLFGYPRIEIDHQLITVPRRKALGLLAYLAVSRRGASRESLAALLWPEHESSKAHAFVRNALWLIRQTPLEAYVTVTRHTIELRPHSSLWIDVEAFRSGLEPCHDHDHPGQMLCADGLRRMREAVEVPRERFLAGFMIDDSRAFEEWQFAESDALMREWAQGLETLARHCEETGDIAGALAYTQRQLTLNPLAEPLYRRLMRLHARTGDRAAAQADYALCEETLQDELGLPPTAETTLLAEQIRTGVHETTAEAMTRSVAPSPLPMYDSDLVGRDAEVADLVARLRDPACRLLSITGPGGSGKTRLAVAVGREIARRYREDTVFVPLASVDTPSLAPSAVLQALGEGLPRVSRLVDNDPLGAIAALVDALSGHEVLIILDNMEHLVRDLRWVKALTEAPPGPRFLTTSRQHLGLPGEWVYTIDGLSFPPPGEPSAPWAQYASVRLFVQNARQADASFTPTQADYAAIGRICALLQGIPLGIELAAAWVATLPCDAIAREIETNLDFLKTQRNLVPKRHRSLRSAFEGSWRLLDREGRRAFRSLAVFRGPFTRDAAERVAGVSLAPLATLIRKSLLHRTDREQVEMLEVVRQYAAERLHALPKEEEILRRSHAEYFLGLLAAQEEQLKGSEQRTSIRSLARQMANLHAAWTNAVADRRFDLIANAAMALFLYCDMSSSYDEAAELLGLAADAMEGQELEAGAVEYGFLRGLHAWFLGTSDHQESQLLFKRASDGLHSQPPTPQSAFVEVLAAFLRVRDVESHLAALQPARTLFEGLRMDWECAALDEALYGLYADASREREAEDALVRSIECRTRRGDRWGEAMAQYALGQWHERNGRPREAQRAYARSAQIREEDGIDPFGLVLCWLRLVHVALAMEQLRPAEEVIQKALFRVAQLGNRLLLARAEEAAAHTKLAQHDRPSAIRYFQRAEAGYTAVGRPAQATRIRALAQKLIPGPSS